MSMTIAERPILERSIEILRRFGNPFRNYFARNPDDEICSRFHVPQLYAKERELLLSVVDLYRTDPLTHSEMIPILGNKGSGKTHLLHSIKHGGDGAWQLLVTPGVFQKETDFLEYLLFQIIDTLLGGGQQRGIRPLDYLSEQLTRRMLIAALQETTSEQRLDLFPPMGLGRWTRKLGLGHTQAQERCQWLIDQLHGLSHMGQSGLTIQQALSESGIPIETAMELIANFIDRNEGHNTAGLMRRSLLNSFARVQLLRDESELASFLTYGFAELEFHVRPSRQDLVLALFKVVMEIFRSLKVPVVVAFDQLEDLLLARRNDDAHKIAEAFFAGIVQVMHQIDGLCFLIFAERGLWNRFVPSLDGYIQDRLNNPVHVPRHGTIKALRLEAPPMEMVRLVVESRLTGSLDELPEGDLLGSHFPFTEEQMLRIVRTEPTLRDMLQQFRHLYDHIVYGPEAQDNLSLHSHGNSTKQVSPNLQGISNNLSEREINSEKNESKISANKPIVGDQPSVSSALTQEQINQDQKGMISSTPVSDRSESSESSVVDFVNPSKSSDQFIEGQEESSNEPLVNPLSTQSESPRKPEGYIVKQIDVIKIEESQGSEIDSQLKSENLGAETISEQTLENRDSDKPLNRLAGLLKSQMEIKSDVISSVSVPVSMNSVSNSSRGLTHNQMISMWQQEQRTALRKLEPEGALPGATRELQAALGTFLNNCLEHGVKVGPWRLQHVVPEFTFGDHPTYGVITMAHWAFKDSQPWRVGIGLFLARAAGKPRDLEIKLSVLKQQPSLIDHLILLRPEDDLSLTGKSKTIWNDSEKQGYHSRLEAISLEGLATIYSFPRWLSAISESLPEGQPVPNLADVIQEFCESLLQQVCMPIQE